MFNSYHLGLFIFHCFVLFLCIHIYAYIKKMFFFFQVMFCVWDLFYFCIFIVLCRHKNKFCFAVICLHVFVLLKLNSLGVNIHT